MKTHLTRLLLLLTIISTNSYAQKLPEVELSGENGGRLDGKAWNSSEIKGKVFAFFYVDPDEKDLNEAASKALSDAHFSLEKYASIAVINMAATWLPNFAIASSLKKKQEQYPDTLYLKDLKKVILDKWSLKDDSSNILIFDKKGNVVFKAMGKLSPVQIKEMLKAVNDNL